MQEAHWLGVDTNTKAHYVFFPSSGNVNIKQNIYFRMLAQLKGEEVNIPVVCSKQAAVSPSPSMLTSLNMLDTPTQAPIQTHQPKQQEEPPILLCRSTHIRKPSHILWDLQSGEGTAPAHTISPLIPANPVKPKMPQLEEVEDKDADAEVNAEEAEGVWMVTNGVPTLLEAFKGLEHAFMAKTANSEALDPCSLAEAKH